MVRGEERERAAWREHVRVVIFEADTPAGRAFDVALLLAISTSVLVVVLESVPAIGDRYGELLHDVEVAFTALFTVEYVLRLISVAKPLRYARSFFGLIDLVSILPTFINLIVPGSQSLLVVRAIRLVRIFRVLKLVRFLGEANVLARAIHASRHKVLVFIGTVVILIVIIGTTMFIIEGKEHGFTSIPRSMYWTLVTMTTVGYGTITPETVPGQILAAFVMIIGYGIIAVPTGIVTAEMVSSARRPVTTRSCPVCTSEGHEERAAFCQDCGAELA